MLAIAHLHKAEVEQDFWRGEFAKRDVTDYVVLPDATGKKRVGLLRVAGFLRQRADGEADFAVMRSDEVSDQVAFNGISRAFQKPPESRAKFVAEAVARALAVFVGRLRLKLPSARGIAIVKHFLELVMSLPDVVPKRGGPERSGECAIAGERGSERAGLSDDKLRVLGDGLP